jgi:hypothetical protein
MTTDNPDFRLVWYTWTPTGHHGDGTTADGRTYYVAGIKHFKVGYTAAGKYNKATQRMMDLYTQGLMDGLPNQLIPLRRNEDTGVNEQRWPLAKIQPKW